ncbi:MFS transporter [Scytonema sp. HK-05]|uniref:MFS transporter n=1 Tax=Scytonema sp. HK-05 TaxID=1137095 RepID=UPI0009357C47|nr:hypothetical protein NIES2130_07280 [Scytonema sp. HK-05]
MRVVRLRDGAIRWGIFHDTADLTRYLETFIVESWVDHLRQYELFTIHKLNNSPLSICQPSRI